MGEGHTHGSTAKCHMESNRESWGRQQSRERGVMWVAWASAKAVRRRERSVRKGRQKKVRLGRQQKELK